MMKKFFWVFALLVITAFCCEAQKNAIPYWKYIVDHPASGQEHISLTTLLMAFALDSSYQTMYFDYRDTEYGFKIARQWKLAEAEKQEFLRQFSDWINAPQAQLVEHPFLRDIAKPWFVIQTEDGNDTDFGSLTVYDMDIQDEDNGKNDQKIVRIEYIRPNRQHVADNYQWWGKIHLPADAIPKLPRGHEICLAISKSETDYASHPAWTSHELQFTIENLGSRPVRLLQATSISDLLQVNFVPCTLSPGQKTSLSASVKPNAFSGRYRREIFLETDAPGQELVKLPIDGDARPPFRIFQYPLEQYFANENSPEEDLRLFDARLQTYKLGFELGPLQAGEIRTFSFCLVPYAPSFKLRMRETKTEAGNATVDFTGTSYGYQMDITICSPLVESTSEIRRTILTVTGGSEEFIIPPPVEIIVNYSTVATENSSQ